MDPNGTAVMNDRGGMCNYAEIWPGFQMNANPTSYHNLGLDSRVTDQRSSHSPRTPPNHNSRKRRDEDELCTKGGAYTSNTNGGDGDNNNNVKINGLNGDNNERLKAVGPNKNKVKKEEVSDKAANRTVNPTESPKQDYILVRARRGQATDSHSLAERARREKISERMKILQELVPGCNKVIGKALVLDVIINYIQSLQLQVEFLSMKLEAVNTKGDIGRYPSKDFAQQTLEAPGMAFGSQSKRECSRSSSPEWLHMQIGDRFERTP
ncbi:hypothetical protein OROGR_010171 [Orobanche gracilis]